LQRQTQSEREPVAVDYFETHQVSQQPTTGREDEVLFYCESHLLYDVCSSTQAASAIFVDG
jgi:hypothetical protein